MKLFFSIIPKSNQNSSSFSIKTEFNFELLDYIVSKAVKKFFPVKEFSKEVKKISFISEEKMISSWLFSNEGDLEENHVTQEKDIYLNLGYTDHNYKEIFKDGYISYKDLEKLSGCFSLIKLSNLGIEVVTDAVGSHPFYFYDTEKYLIISTRTNVLAFVVNQLLTDKDIEYNIEGCRQFALQGHFFGRHTGFKGITSSTVHEYINASAEGLYFYNWLQTGIKEISLESSNYNIVLQDISNALINSFKFVENNDLHLSITGGRDSRLIAAALSNIKNINVRTATMGHPSDPDVLIGEQLAKKLGWQHSIKPISKSENDIVYAENPVSRVLRALDVHDCSTSAWDDFSDYSHYSSSPTMSGVGGEILRGGMTLTNKSKLSSEEAFAIIDNTMCGGSFFKNDILHASKTISSEIKSLATKNPHDSLDVYYHKHRNARWVGARRNGNRTKWNVVDPLMDNALVCGALKVPSNLRWSERLVFDLIRTLSPQIRDLPLEGQMWRFDRKEADSKYSFLEGMHLRHSIKKEKNTASYDWRKLTDPSMKSFLKEQILNNQSNVCDILFEKDRLEKHIEENRYPQTTWHIFTMALFTQGAWKDTSRKPKIENIKTSPSSY